MTLMFTYVSLQNLSSSLLVSSSAHLWKQKDQCVLLLLDRDNGLHHDALKRERTREEEEELT